MAKRAHKRHSTRLRGYDYSQPGAYFITICAQSRENLFGDIFDGEMHLKPQGQIAQGEWARLPTRFETIECGEFVVMPNHVHGILFIVDTGRGAAANIQDENPATTQLRPYTTNHTHTHNHTPQTNVTPGSIGAILRAYKSSVTRRINRTRFTSGAPLWQRNYYERIIRNENELNLIREYILDNPRSWAEDKENPLVGAK